MTHELTRDDPAHLGKPLHQQLLDQAHRRRLVYGTDKVVRLLTQAANALAPMPAVAPIPLAVDEQLKVREPHTWTTRELARQWMQDGRRRISAWRKPRELEPTDEARDVYRTILFVPAGMPPSVRESFEWLISEQAYIAAKFDFDENDDVTAGPDPLAPSSAFNETDQSDLKIAYWSRQLENYYSRAKYFGLDTPQGRQAIAKFAATAVGLMQSTIRVHGPIPQSGVSSGEIAVDSAPDV